MKTTELFKHEFNIDDVRKQLGGMKVHAVIVQKGGTGKTTITSNICYTLAKKGFKVLAIDTDSQASLTDLCNLLPTDLTDNEDFSLPGLAEIYDNYVDQYDKYQKKYISLDEFRETAFDLDMIRQLIVPALYRNISSRLVKSEDGATRQIVQTLEPLGFDILPADIDLSNRDIDMGARSLAVVLYQLVQIIREEYDYDFIIIDCPPGFTNLAYNAIAAATDGCIVPVNLEIMTIRGARNLIRTVAEIQELLWKNMGNILHKGILGIIKNRYVPKRKLQKSLSETVDTLFPIPSFETYVPSYTSCDKAHMMGQLYVQQDKKAEAAFEELCSEIVFEDIRRRDETEPIIFKNFGEDFGTVSAEEVEE